MLRATGSAFGPELFSEGKVQSVETEASGTFGVSFGHIDNNFNISVKQQPLM